MSRSAALGVGYSRLGLRVSRESGRKQSELGVRPCFGPGATGMMKRCRHGALYFVELHSGLPEGSVQSGSWGVRGAFAMMFGFQKERPTL